MDPATPASGTGRPAFSLKALAFGIAGTLAIAAGAFFNDDVLHQTPLIGNHFPAAPYALVLLAVLFWNPTIGRLANRLRFSSRELAVALCLMLFCAWLPGAGFFRYYQRSVVMPQLQVESKPEWKKQDILSELPAQAFPLRGSAEAWALHRAVVAERDELAAGRIPGAEAAAYAVALDRLDQVSGKAFAADAQAAFPDAGAAADQARSRVKAGFEARLPAAQKEFETVYNGFQQGIPIGDQALPFKDVPFAAWLPTLWLWAPLVACFALALIALSLVVHRQWSYHEQLSYPIAQVTSAMLEQRADSPVSSVLRSRLFWFGMVPVLGVHLLNYVAVWFPGQVPSLALGWGHWGILFNNFDSAHKVGDCGLGHGHLYFAVVGLAYFISAEISLSMGVSALLLFVFSVQFYLATGQTTDMESGRSGAYFGYAAILLYTGRHYYWAVAQRACGLGGGASGELRESVWAARIFLAAFVGFTWVLTVPFGLDWLVAVLLSLTLMVVFLVFTRIICETGVPFLQMAWHPATMMGNVLGVSALGAGPTVIIFYLNAVLAIDPRECLMPYAANSYRLAENHGFGRLRLLWIGFAVMLVALAVGFVAWGWGSYERGCTQDGFAINVAAGRLDVAARMVGSLQDTGQAGVSAAAHGLGKLALVGNNTGHGKELGWMAFGVLAVIGFSVARFRFSWWPLHPVIFLVWGTWTASLIWVSFLVGWAAKGLVVKFGGGRAYNDLKPLFIGLIVGELMAVGVTVVFGCAYYLATGLLPKTMAIFPG